MINKGLILKTAAVVSCVIALGITGCQGGNNEAAAVKNKSNIEVSIQNAKGESVDVQRDGKEDIEAVGRCTEPSGAGTEAGSSDTKPVNGYVGADEAVGQVNGYDREASGNDNERNEEKGRTDPKADSKAEQPEDEDIHAGEKDRGTDSSSESLGAGDGFNAASAVSSISDMESTDSAGWDGGMENDSAVSEYSESGYTDNAGLGNEDDNSGFESEQSEYSYDSTDQYEYEDPGTVESGEGSTEGYDESVFESAVPDAEYSESDGMEYDGTEESLTYQGQFVATAYCSCPICTGSYSSGYTASGTWATEGRTIACNIYPFGTQLMIDGHIYTVEDTGWSPYGDAWVDLFFESHESALAYGCRTVEVYLVN